MAYANILTVAAGTHGASYDSGVLTNAIAPVVAISTLTELTVTFVPALTVAGGSADSYSVCYVYAVDVNSNQLLLGTLTVNNQARTFTAALGDDFGASIDIKVLPGIGQPLTSFALNVQGK